MERFPNNKQPERIDFFTCPKCKRAVRVDDINHPTECSGGFKKIRRIEDDPMYKKIKDTQDSKERQRVIHPPSPQNPPGKKAIRRAEARAEVKKAAIPSSWKPEKTKKIGSIISTHFESNRRKH
ncbi:MAG TPA: hypothetical protein VJK04_03530 [Candidatus Paceibacterota bacterium]